MANPEKKDWAAIEAAAHAKGAERKMVATIAEGNDYIVIDRTTNNRKQVLEMVIVNNDATSPVAALVITASMINRRTGEPDFFLSVIPRTEDTKIRGVDDFSHTQAPPNDPGHAFLAKHRIRNTHQHALTSTKATVRRLKLEVDVPGQLLDVADQFMTAVGKDVVLSPREEKAGRLSSLTTAMDQRARSRERGI